jgi:subtilase family serine protease
MKKIASIALVSGILTLSGAPAAMAQLARPVEHSGNIFHIAVCARGVGRGVARCHAHLVTDGRGVAHAMMKSGGRLGAAPNAPKPTYVVPAQVRAAYNISGTGNSGTTVAIVDAYGYPNAEADLAQFRAEFGLGSCTKANGCLRIVNQGGGTSIPYPSNTGWDVEQAADLDTVSTMCPNCKILLVEASSANFNDLAAAVRTAASLGAHVISNSYGGSETGSNPFETAYNQRGIAVTASTGDSGYGAQFPATSAHVIAVGGTTLNMRNLTRQSETAWSGAGSGCSSLYGEPAWQLPSNADMAKNTLCTMRMEADVSADADPNTGVVFYMNVPPYAPGFYIVGGTSISNQIIAGIYGERADAVNYASGIYSHSAALFDITSGTNAPPSCGGTYFCVSGKGYDGPTGLGTPNGDTAF